MDSPQTHTATRVHQGSAPQCVNQSQHQEPKLLGGEGGGIKLPETVNCILHTCAKTYLHTAMQLLHCKVWSLSSGHKQPRSQPQHMRYMVTIKNAPTVGSQHQRMVYFDLWNLIRSLKSTYCNLYCTFYKDQQLFQVSALCNRATQ